MRKEVKLNKEQIAQVVLDLIGNVSPVGSTHVDKKRLNNLEVMGEVFYSLFEEITDIIYYNKSAVEYSVQTSVKKAKKIIENTITDWVYDNMKDTFKYIKE